VVALFPSKLSATCPFFESSRDPLDLIVA